MIPPLCPTCGRRASQRANYFPSMGRGGFIECRSPFHDAGDWGPEMLDALKLATNWAKMFLMGCTIHESQELSCQEDVQRIDDLLAAVEGRKGEVRDG